MTYDFTTKITRRDTGSCKWDAMYALDPAVDASVVPLSTADMEFKNPPELIAGLKKHLESAILGYTGPTGTYKNAVKQWMKTQHNWDIEPDWIVNTTGVVPAIFSAIQACTHAGDGVIIMPPVYRPFYNAITLQHRKLALCELIEKNGYYTIDFEKLEKLAKDPGNKALLFCSPHNPVGRVWNRHELQKVKNIILENGLRLLSDEIHFDIIMPGYTHTVMQSLDSTLADNTITFTAPSKTFNIAGLGISNIIIKNQELRHQFKKAQEIGNNTPFTAIGYKACEICYTECAPWLTACIAVIDTNQKLVQAFFKANQPAITARLIEGTYLQWIDFRALDMNYKDLEHFMIHTAHTFFNAGHIFGASGRGFARMNVAAPTSVIQEALERLDYALQTLKR